MKKKVHARALEDYFTIREEPSLHLTHYMHPYKGRFHPKMVRALLNYVYPNDDGLVMDNFAGCGTLLVEATWMGLDNLGIEINPLSVLMSNVKCHSLTLNPTELKRIINDFLSKLQKNILSYQTQITGNKLLSQPSYDLTQIKEKNAKIPKKITTMFQNVKSIDKILIAHELLKKISKKKIQDFILLGLSGTISDLTRRRQADFFEVFKDRLHDLYIRIYIFHKLNEALRIKLGTSQTSISDTRDMKHIQTESIDGIVNSPPYSTALDYIKNDLPQLILLEMDDISTLEKNMIGNPKAKVYPNSLLDEMREDNPMYSRLPPEAKDIIAPLRRYERKKESMRTYKFFEDMYHALEEMFRIMKDSSKCAIVIGNNNYKLGEKYRVVDNAVVLKKMALNIGFIEDRSIERELEKTRSGMIRCETILVLEKPGDRKVSKERNAS